jgi:hypothetical protein
LLLLNVIGESPIPSPSRVWFLWDLSGSLLILDSFHWPTILIFLQ